MLMCPQCGWQYNPRQFSKPGDDGRPFALTPTHAAKSVADNNRDLANADWGSCHGSEQCPRNPDADRRPLWNGESNPHLQSTTEARHDTE